MCLVCGRLWTALQVLWSTFYVICGAAQLMVGVFFLISVPDLQLYGVLIDGAWNLKTMVSRIASMRERDQSSKSDYFFQSQIRMVYQKPNGFKTASWIVFFLTFVLAVILAIVLRQQVRWFRTNTTHVTQSPDVLEPFNPECTEPGARVDKKMGNEAIDEDEDDEIEEETESSIKDTIDDEVEEETESSIEDTN